MISGPVRPARDGGKPQQLVVLLHGYGADGEDLIGLADPLGEALPAALFAAPNAPARSAQSPFGYEWFPLDFGDIGTSIRAGLPVARPLIVDYLDDLWSRTGLGPEATFLCGFSQGAMLALHAGLAMETPLLGIISFSGALVPATGFGTQPKPPVCLIHGDSDEVMETERTLAAAEQLAAAGYDVSLHISPGLAHGIDAAGLDFATAFMRARLRAATA